MSDYENHTLDNEEKVLDWYQKLRKKIAVQLAKRKTSDNQFEIGSAKLGDLLISLPDFFHLGAKLLFDGDVPARNKGALVAALAYVISPIDLIPDNIPIAGWIDDLVVMAMGLNSFLDTDDPLVVDAVNKHWAGDGDVFETIKHVLDIADEAATFLPKRLINIVKGMFPKNAGK